MRCRDVAGLCGSVPGQSITKAPLPEDGCIKSGGGSSRRSSDFYDGGGERGSYPGWLLYSVWGPARRRFDE